MVLHKYDVVDRGVRQVWGVEGVMWGREWHPMGELGRDYT